VAFACGAPRLRAADRRAVGPGTPNVGVPRVPRSVGGPALGLGRTGAVIHVPPRRRWRVPRSDSGRVGSGRPGHVRVGSPEETDCEAAGPGLADTSECGALRTASRSDVGLLGR
jgi:glucokinase